MFVYHGYECLTDPRLYKADHCCLLLSRAIACRVDTSTSKSRACVSCASVSQNTVSRCTPPVTVKNLGFSDKYHGC